MSHELVSQNSSPVFKLFTLRYNNYSVKIVYKIISFECKNTTVKQVVRREGIELAHWYTSHPRRPISSNYNVTVALGYAWRVSIPTNTTLTVVRLLSTRQFT